MDEETESWSRGDQEDDGEVELDDEELNESDLDDIPLHLSDSEASPGPSTPPSQRSERTASARETGEFGAGSPGDSADVCSSAADDEAPQQRQQRHRRQPDRPPPPKFALQLPGSNPLGGSNRGRSSPSPAAPNHNNNSSSAPPSRPRVPPLLGVAPSPGGGAGGAGAVGCVRTAKPPPLALFVTSASSPVQSPARTTPGADPTSGGRFSLQRPHQLQSAAATAKAQPSIHVQLLLPAFDLVLPRGGAAAGIGAAGGGGAAGDDPESGAAQIADACAVRNSIACALGVAPQYLAFYSAQPADLATLGNAAAATTAAADSAAAEPGALSTSSWASRTAGSRLAASSSVNERTRTNGSGSGSSGGTGVPVGSSVVVGLSDGACSFSLADLEDSLLRAEQAAAAMRDQGAAHEALQQQLVLKGMEVAERGKDCQRLRERETLLQQELQRIKCVRQLIVTAAAGCWGCWVFVVILCVFALPHPVQPAHPNIHSPPTKPRTPTHTPNNTPKQDRVRH